MPRNQLLAIVIVAAAAAFAIGLAIESSDERSDSGEPHVEASESEGEAAEDAAEASRRPEDEDALLGIDAESTPLVVAAVALSVALAAAVWLRPDLELLLILVAAAMLAFAVLDVREVVHQSDESNGGLAALAGVVATLHLAAAALAFRMARADPA
jgi:hypothetical protein